ncbi:MAG: type II secretion system F family protein [Eubacteriales bacterium]
MDKYKYKASNSQGQIIEGVYEASSADDVRAMIREKHFFPLEITKQAETLANKDIVIFSKISLKVVYIFCEQFGAILRSGVPMVKGLEMMITQCENKDLQKVLADVSEKVRSGTSMSNAFREHSKRFPGIFISMIEAGEASGTLELSFRRMGIMFKKDAKQKSKIKGAMTYPTILAIVVVVVVIILLKKVVPTFEAMFAGAGADLPGITQALIDMSDFVENYLGLMIAITAIIAVLFWVFLRTEQGRLGFDKFKTKIPMIGKLYGKILASRFTRTLSTLFASGVSLTDSMDITARSMINKYVEERLVNATSKIKQGVPLSESITAAAIFPVMVSQMVKVGEESGTLDDLLTKVSDYYEEESENAVSQLMGMMEPAITLVLGGIVLFIVLAIMIPMFNMGNLV